MELNKMYREAVRANDNMFLWKTATTVVGMGIGAAATAGGAVLGGVIGAPATPVGAVAGVLAGAAAGSAVGSAAAIALDLWMGSGFDQEEAYVKRVTAEFREYCKEKQGCPDDYNYRRNDAGVCVLIDVPDTGP